MDIFGDALNPCGMDWPFTVFEASFSKGSNKLDGKCPFTLSMTGEGNMYACVAYQADVAGLGLDEEGKFALLNAYLENGGFVSSRGRRAYRYNSASRPQRGSLRICGG
jgi:hypothetical protein